MQPQLSPGVYARLEASSVRRGFAFVVLLALGALLVYLSFVSLGGLASRAILFVFGVLAIFAADRLRQATLGTLELTEAGIQDGEGRVLIEWDNVRSVERGAFALKPSNGFTVHTKDPMKREWAPGLWWRLGRRFGVGGVSSAGAAKFMAEQIAFRIAQRD